MTAELLACPLTRLPLRSTTRGLVCDDGSRTYGVVDGFPNLLAPEAIGAAPTERGEQRYSEAYAEMAYYDEVSSSWAERLASVVSAEQSVDPRRASDDPVLEGARLVVLARSGIDRSRFPRPARAWLHLRHEGPALFDAYRHLAPLDGKRVLQIGGIGLDAVKFLLGGAAEVWLVSPMLGELRFARTLAAATGLTSRVRCLRGLAEELPFRTGSFDAVFAGGSLHHTVTELSLPEIARVLRPGGLLASVEPWRAPGYELGTRLFGKREPVPCRPMSPRRVAPLFQTFRDVRVVHHGSLTRYPLIALERVGVRVPTRAVWMAARCDDAISSLVPPLRGNGSSVALLAAR
jgi:SAM-dependent methyltransferase/uncharacterized protein YbaR (Trm112 family)